MQAFAAASFKALPYSDPFPPASTPSVMTYSQPASSVVLNEYVNGVGLPVTRSIPSLTNGFGAITLEWWLKQKPGSGSINSNPNGTLMTGPGFAVTADWQWGGGPGSVIVNLFQNKGGQYSGNRGAVFPLPNSDEQWHHYVVTYDLRTVRTYFDGELLEQKWIDNNAERIGPYNDDQFTITPSIVIGKNWQNGYLEGARVSSVALTPWQVKRNFENTKNFSKTLYVAPGASGSGTQGSPMSLASAMAQVGGNTRIILAGGTYNGSDFQVTRSGASPRDNCLIIGADGSTPAIISGGSPALSGAGWITLRNITFSSDNTAALQINNAPQTVIVDACRFSGNGRGLSISSSPKVRVENCVVNAGTGIYVNNSADAVVRQNTIVNGSVGVHFDTSSVRAGFLNNLMSGQSSVCLQINNSQQFFRGNGNLYNPASGTAVSINGANYSPAQVRDKTLPNAFYNLDVADVADSRQRRTGYASESQSMAFAPTFADAANGDYRLASVQANAIDAGADRTLMHWQPGDERGRRGVLPTTVDAMGVLRPQGNGPDVGAFETVPLSYAVFNLDADYTCSAGVYKSDGTLVRTLFSGQRKAQGTNVVFWNGLDDLRNPLPNDTYTIKMIAHNVQYVWEGVVGNSSSPNSASHAHGGFEPIWGIAIAGTTAFYTAGYNENKYELYRFDTSNPNNVTKQFGPFHNIYSDAATDVATDGNKLYTVNSAQIAIYNVSDCSATTFGNGQSKVNSGNGRGWIEVQRNGNLLFVSRRDQNAIYIFDKNSGNQTGQISVSAPTDLALTATGDLWVLSGTSAIRYQVSSGGGNAVQTISGFGNPVNIACSPLDGTVIVADASGHVVKAFGANGSALWTHGQPNGYASSPKVTADKFYFLHEDQGRRTYMAPLAFQPDGTFWVCDTFISRSLHFSQSRQLLHEIDFQPHTYTSSVDLNNPSRVFNRWTEYFVDYSKPPGSAWTITNFWGFEKPTYMYGFEDGPLSVVTLNNGRTYGTVYDGGAGSTREVVELTATGLRETSVKGLSVYTRIEKDGSIYSSGVNGSTATFFKKALTGFNASGDPQWGGQSTLASAPASTAYLNSDPVSWRAPQQTPNVVVSYDNERLHTGFKLGGVKPGSNQWLWRALPTVGGIDGYGTADSWCEYGGNYVMATGRNIIAGFHGEFWNEQGQANQFYHYYDNGLFVGQFGGPTVPGVAIFGPGASGNAFSPTLVNVGSEAYMFHNDEWGRGTHRWHPVGLSAIRELSSAITQGQAPTGTTNTPSSGVTNNPVGGGGTGGTSTNGSGGTTNTPPSTNTPPASAADLVVTAFSLDTNNPVAGAPVKFTATIANQGGTATDLATLGVAFYVDDVKVAWWYQDGTLAPGASMTVTSFDGPNSNLGIWTATNGTHTFMASVDDAGRITESNETNNTKSFSLNIGTTTTTNSPISIADLVVTAVSMTPTNPAPGATVYFKATIKNQGQVASTNATAGCSFYVNGTKTNWWYQGNLSIAPGQSMDIVSMDDWASTGGKWIATAGTYSLKAVVDDANRIVESNESNNTMTVSFTVGSTTSTNTNTTSTNTNVKTKIRPAGGGKLALDWAATAGSTYTVSYATNINATNWTKLSTNVTATTTSLSYTDAPPATAKMRFYNVTKN